MQAGGEGNVLHTHTEWLKMTKLILLQMTPPTQRAPDRLLQYSQVTRFF